MAARADGGTDATIAQALANWRAEMSDWRASTASEISGVRSMIIELEQAIADRGYPRPHMPGSLTASLADSLVKDDAWLAVAGKKQAKTAIEVNANQLLNIEANTITYDDDYFNVTERQPGIVSGMTQRTWLRQLLVTIPTNGGAIEFSRELAFSNNSAPQGGGSPFAHEGVEKPESAITYEQVEQKIATIAHFIKASKQILADVPMLRNTLDSRLLYGLELAFESQIIAGDGTGANMSGLTKSGNYTAFTPTSGDTAIDSINRALAALEVANAVPNLIIMHPNDFRAMQRLKATGGSEEYLFGAPSGSNTANVWNTAIYRTTAITEGEFIVCDTSQLGVIFMREDAQVQVGWVDDDFTKNLVTLLAEFRATIAVQRPAAVRYGDLTT